MNEHDFATALKKVKKTGESAASFQQKSNKKRYGDGNIGDIVKGIQLLQRLMGGSMGATEEQEEFYDVDDEMKIPEMD